jgi:hypothetical protein
MPAASSLSRNCRVDLLSVVGEAHDEPNLYYFEPRILFSYRPLNSGTSQSAVSSSCFLLVPVRRGAPIRQPRTANQSKLLCLVFLTITQIWPNHMRVETFSCVFMISVEVSGCDILPATLKTAHLPPRLAFCGFHVGEFFPAVSDCYPPCLILKSRHPAQSLSSRNL